MTMAVLYPVHRGLGADPQPGFDAPAQPDGDVAGRPARRSRWSFYWLAWLPLGLAVPPPEAFLTPRHDEPSRSAPKVRQPTLLSRLTTGGLSRGAAQHHPRSGSSDTLVEDRPETPEIEQAPDATGRRTARQLGAYLRGDKWLPQLIRFALVGGFSNIGYFLLFMACYGGGAQLANLTGSIVSTALANEMHRRLTFHAADRVGWLTAQLEGGGLALAGLAITSASLAALDFIAPGMSDVAEALAVIAIAAAVGTLRFLTLRLWVF
ncbi:GtrA family protein [Nocardia wallacei]|uniref:GtrA family protein n=1 Tax=Nocardia wallacei TaxID=480035 RepID=UPI00313B9B8C